MNAPTMQTYAQTPTDVVRPASRIDFADRLLGAEAPAHFCTETR